MNEQMEKLNEKNEEITTRLKINFTFHLVVIIFFVVVGACFISCGIRTQMIMLKALCFVAGVLSFVIGNWIRNSYILLIKGEMRNYKHCVDVAMHHRESIKKFEKSEGNHIPKID